MAGSSHEAAAEMDPPAYTPTPKRTINDLRTQILANGTLPGHLKAAHLLMRSNGCKARTPIGQEIKASSSTNPAKHYAVLCQRSCSKSDVRVILKGQPRDTVEEALEWMLEKTECLMHDMMVSYGRTVDDVCSVM